MDAQRKRKLAIAMMALMVLDKEATKKKKRKARFWSKD